MPAVEPRKLGPSVKSAERTIQVFEIFHERQCPLSVSEIADALATPQSSTSILLQSLRRQGYLVYDAAARRYLPSIRLPVITEWINQARFPEPRLYDAMIGLGDRFGHLVALAVRKDLYYEIIGLVPARTDLRYVMRHRELRPLSRTTIGNLILSAHDDAAVARILHHANSCETDLERCVNVAETTARIGEWRRAGFAYTESHAVPDVSVLAVLLPQQRMEENLVLAVMGPVQQFRPIVDDARAELLAIQDRLGWRPARTKTEG